MPKLESLKNLYLEDVGHLESLSKFAKRINTPENFAETLRAVLDSVVESMEWALFSSSEASFRCRGPRLD